MKRTTGIVVRHGRACATKAGGKCNCTPSYRAQANTKSGKVRRTFSGTGARAAAIAWRHDVASAVNRGAYVGPTRTTFRGASAAWLQGASADPPTVLTRGGRVYKPSALRSVRHDSERYLYDAIGDMRLSDIHRGTMQGLVDQLVGRGLSSSRVKNITNASRVVFRFHVERGTLQVNPCANLRLPATPDAVNRSTEPTVAFAWIEAVPAQDRAMWAMAFLAGLRRGELQALRWSDITLQDDAVGPLAGWVNVTRGWDAVAGPILPKNRKSRRVPIVQPYLADALEAHRRLTGRAGDDYVFGTTATQPFEDYEGRTAKALKAANVRRAEQELEPLPALGLHRGRHTYGGLCRAAGIPGDDISDYLGHSRPGVTARYTSPIELDARDADNMKRLADYLARASSADRIEQLEAAGHRPDADDLARALVERFGEDALERVAEILMVPVKG